MNDLEAIHELRKVKADLAHYSGLMLEASVQLESIKKENVALKESLTKMVGTFEEALEKGLVKPTEDRFLNESLFELGLDNYQDYKEACKILGIKPKELAG